MIDAKTLTQTITVHVKIKRWKELADWISWFNIETELEESEDETL